MSNMVNKNETVMASNTDKASNNEKNGIYAVCYSDGSYVEEINEDNAIVYGVSYDEALKAYNNTHTSEDCSSYVVMLEMVDCEIDEYECVTTYDVVRMKQRIMKIEFYFEDGTMKIYDFDDPENEESWVGSDIDDDMVYDRFTEEWEKAEDYKLFLSDEEEEVYE